MMRAVVIMLCLCAVGCGRSQVRDAANAKACAQAYQAETDPAIRARIADAMAAFVLAALDDYSLPDPDWTPDEIRADPGDVAAAAAEAQADPKPYEAPPATDVQRYSLPSDLRELGVSLWGWGAPIGAVGVMLALFLWIAGRKGWGGWLIQLIAGPVVRPLINLAALWGSAAAAAGVACRWLADWWWAVLLVALCAGGLAAWINWRDLRAWWSRKRLGLKVGT